MNRFTNLWASVSAVGHMIGALLLIIAASMLLPISVSILYAEGDLNALALGALSAGLPGFLLWYFCKRKHEINTREAIIVASLGWIVIAGVSAVPFVIDGHIGSYTDAFLK